MAVTARFKVTRRTPYDYATEIEMTPDYAQGRNSDWALATPAGMIRLTIKNELAAEQFKEGAPVHVLFEFPTE
jgi:hypothetical protein